MYGCDVWLDELLVGSIVNLKCCQRAKNCVQIEHVFGDNQLAGGQKTSWCTMLFAHTQVQTCRQHSPA